MKTFVMCLAITSLALVSTQSVSAADARAATVSVDGGAPTGTIQILENGKTEIALTSGYRVAIYMKDGKPISATATDKKGVTAPATVTSASRLKITVVVVVTKDGAKVTITVTYKS